MTSHHRSMAAWLYLDQNYLSGIVKAKPAFLALEPALREAVARGAVAVPQSPAHAIESAPRPDLALLELLSGLSGGLRLPPAGPRERELRARLAAVLAREYPQRVPRASDDIDLDVLSVAIPHCSLVTCDAHMASVCRRARADALHGAELFTGRRPDVERLTRRLTELTTSGGGG